ncbi:hypothetical protein MPSEU_000202000 [Mayamaea pseudoterrestris]|nr:hypothetical protein MPSEU_000202000 [Mayamaea pseudoterrestris]
MQRLISFSLLCSLATAQFQGNNEFHITSQATITCSTAGFKCGYNEEDFNSVDASGTGQVTVGGFGGIENLVWSPLDVSTDTLTLDTCQVDYCLVVCNVGCDCVDESGAACADGSFAPTSAPTADTGSQTCPQVKNTQYCEELSAVVQPGNLDNFDCFNFCGGATVGTCSFDGVCGDLTCSNATDGGALGLVQGCTKALLLGDDGGSASGAQSLRLAWLALYLAVTMSLALLV